MGGTCSRSREDLPARREIVTPVRNPHRAFIAGPGVFELPLFREVPSSFSSRSLVRDDCSRRMVGIRWSRGAILDTELKRTSRTLFALTDPSLEPGR